MAWGITMECGIAVNWGFDQPGQTKRRREENDDDDKQSHAKKMLKTSVVTGSPPKATSSEPKDSTQTSDRPITTNGVDSGGSYNSPNVSALVRTINERLDEQDDAIEQLKAENRNLREKCNELAAICNHLGTQHEGMSAKQDVPKEPHNAKAVSLSPSTNESAPSTNNRKAITATPQGAFTGPASESGNSERPATLSNSLQTALDVLNSRLDLIEEAVKSKDHTKDTAHQQTSAKEKASLDAIRFEISSIKNEQQKRYGQVSTNHKEVIAAFGRLESKSSPPAERVQRGELFRSLPLQKASIHNTKTTASAGSFLKTGTNATTTGRTNLSSRN